MKETIFAVEERFSTEGPPDREAIQHAVELWLAGELQALGEPEITISRGCR